MIDQSGLWKGGNAIEQANSKQAIKGEVARILKKEDEVPDDKLEGIIEGIIKKKVGLSSDEQRSDADSVIEGMQIDETMAFDLSLLLDNLSASGKLRFVSPEVLRRAYLRMIEIGMELAEAEEGIGEPKKNTEHFLQAYGDVKTLCDAVEGLRGQEQEAAELGTAEKVLELASLYREKLAKTEVDENTNPTDLLKTPILTEPIMDRGHPEGEERFNALQAKLLAKALQNELGTGASQTEPKVTVENSTLKAEAQQGDKSGQNKPDQKDKSKDEKTKETGTIKTRDKSGNLTTYDQIGKIIGEYSKADTAKQKDLVNQVRNVIAYELLTRSGMSSDKVHKLLLETDEHSSKRMQKARESVLEKADSVMKNIGIYDEKKGLTNGDGQEKLNNKINTTVHNMMAQASLGTGLVARTDAQDLTEEQRKAMMVKTMNMDQGARDDALIDGLSSDKPGKMTKIWRNIFGPSPEELAKSDKPNWMKIGITALFFPPLLLLYKDEILNSTPIKVIVGVCDGVKMGVNTVGLIVGSGVGLIGGTVEAIKAPKGQGGAAFKECMNSYTKSSINNIKETWGGFAQLPGEIEINKQVTKFSEQNKLDIKDSGLDKFIAKLEPKSQSKLVENKQDPVDVGAKPVDKTLSKGSITNDKVTVESQKTTSQDDEKKLTAEQAANLKKVLKQEKDNLSKLNDTGCSNSEKQSTEQVQKKSSNTQSML